MSLIITRNFKRAKAQDAAAKDKAPDGWWEGKTIFAAFGWGKSVKGKVVSHRGGVIKLEDGTQFKESDAYDLYAIDSRAMDACEDSAEELKSANGKVLKVGSLVVPMSFTDKENKRHLSRVVLKIIPKGKSEFGPYVFLKGGIAPYKPNDLYAFDGCEDSAQFKIGDKVRRGKQTGIVRGIEKEPYIEVKFTDEPVTVFVHESEIKAANSRAADACEDSAAKFRIGQEVIVKTKYAEPYKARIVGLWDMSQNGPYNEQGYLIKNIKGGGVESMPEHALSLVTAKDSAELNNDADLRAALSKMADIAKRLTDAKVSFKAGWTPDGIGEIILEFPDIESARKYNYYKLFNAWDAARSQIVPRWAVNIGGYRVPRIEGNRMTISILHFST